MEIYTTNPIYLTLTSLHSFTFTIVSGTLRARRIVFLVTDGQSDHQGRTLESAKRLKRLNVEIFVITVGIMGKNAINEMANVASRPPENYVFRVEKKNYFEYVFQPASQKIDPNKYQARKSLKYRCNYYNYMSIMT